MPVLCRLVSFHLILNVTKLWVSSTCLRSTTSSDFKDVHLKPASDCKFWSALLHRSVIYCRVPFEHCKDWKGKNEQKKGHYFKLNVNLPFSQIHTKVAITQMGWFSLFYPVCSISSPQVSHPFSSLFHHSLSLTGPTGLFWAPPNTNIPLTNSTPF